LYQLISDYMTKIGGMAQVLTSPKAPSQFKALLIEASRISAKVLTRIIDDYATVPDAEAVVLDPLKVLDIEKCLMESADIIQEQQQQQQQQQAAQKQPQAPQQMGPPPQGSGQPPLAPSMEQGGMQAPPPEQEMQMPPEEEPQGML